MPFPARVLKFSRTFQRRREPTEHSKARLLALVNSLQILAIEHPVAFNMIEMLTRRYVDKRRTAPVADGEARQPTHD